MEQLGVKILDREYKLAVKPEEKERLLEAVSIVDEKMRSLRDTGKIAGLERVAVMAALQIAHEMLGTTIAGTSTPTGDIQRKIRRMTNDIEAEVKRQERLF